MKSTSKTFTKVQVDHIVQHDPIEYKKVDPNQFTGYSVNQIPVQQDKNGYVNTDLLKEFKKVDKCTTIVNVGIGQGKTTAIYEYIKYLSQNKDYVVVLASPFITLVEKDYRELTETHKIAEDQILLYSDLETERVDALVGLPVINYGYLMSNQSLFKGAVLPKKRIHVITINSLLGNPGESAFVQSTLKHDYLSALLDYCKSSTKKLVFILDEIHESVHNFANPFIYNIMRWKDVTHKAILLTATYTAPVDIIVKHFAYLTNDTIKILESDRLKKKSNPANLHLCYTNKNYSSIDISELEFIKYIIAESDSVESNHRKVQILSFSRRIARAIFDLNSEWLPNRDVNLSTSSSSEKFDPLCSNIGTTFKTGVNIETRDLVFIILPCKYTDDLLRGEYGIFSDGVPSIVQSIARMRTDGDIYVIIPPVTELIKADYLEEYTPLDTHKSNNPIIKLETKPDDTKELEDIYNLIYKRIQNTESIYKTDIKKKKKNRKLLKLQKQNRPKIQYPKLDTFILERGQQFLVSRFLLHGKFVSPFIIYSAFHDQLVNANLKYIYTYELNTIDVSLNSATLIDDLYKFIISTDTDLTQKDPIALFNDLRSTFTKPQVNSIHYNINVEYDGNALKGYASLTIGLLHIMSLMHFLLNKEKAVFNKSTYLNYHISIATRTKRKLNSVGTAYKNLGSILKIIDSRIKSAKLLHLPRVKISSFYTGHFIKANEMKDLENAIQEICKNDPAIKMRFTLFKDVSFSLTNIDTVYNHIQVNFLTINEKKSVLNNNIRTHRYVGLRYTSLKYLKVPRYSHIFQ